MQPTLEYKYKYFIQQGYARMVSRMWSQYRRDGRRAKYFIQQAYARMMSRMWFQYHGHAGDERRHANCSYVEWERRKKEKENARNTP